jgi:hypothetical protein
MNQQFSLRRFVLLLKLDLAENRKTYLLTLALVLGLMLLLMLPILGANESRSDHIALHMVAFSVCLLLGGSLFSSTAFSAYSSQPRGIATMMVPASKLERFLVPFLVNLVFLLVFLSIFWGLHYGLISVVNTRLQSVDPNAGIFYPAPIRVAQVLSYLYVLAVAATLAGSIWFNKNGFIKSAATLLAVLVGLCLLNLFLARTFTSHDLFALPFEGWRFFDDKSSRMYGVEMPEPVQGLIWAGLLAVVLGLWYLAYVRLKEKEI